MSERHPACGAYRPSLLGGPLRCEFCGRFMRHDGKGHEPCLRGYDRSMSSNG